MWSIYNFSIAAYKETPIAQMIFFASICFCLPVWGVNPELMLLLNRCALGKTHFWGNWKGWLSSYGDLLYVPGQRIYPEESRYSAGGPSLTEMFPWHPAIWALPVLPLLTRWELHTLQYCCSRDRQTEFYPIEEQVLEFPLFPDWIFMDE